MEADRASIIILPITPQYSVWGFDVWMNIASSNTHLFQNIKSFYDADMKELLSDIMTSDYVI